jgi:hypothetical protein
MTSVRRRHGCVGMRQLRGNALDAEKVVERAKLMGVPAVQIGKVGGEKLIVKTATGEFPAPLDELHNASRNSIARAMA